MHSLAILYGMKREPFCRSHMIRAAMMGSGVALDGIQNFIERLDALEAGGDRTWDRKLSLAEMTELSMIMDENDSERCRQVFSLLLDDISSFYNVPVGDLRSWASSTEGFPERAN